MDDIKFMTGLTLNRWWPLKLPSLKLWKSIMERLTRIELKKVYEQLPRARKKASTSIWNRVWKMKKKSL